VLVVLAPRATVGAAGKIVGDFMPNPNYDSGK
jgi:hypothetical protein